MVTRFGPALVIVQMSSSPDLAQVKITCVFPLLNAF